MERHAPFVIPEIGMPVSGGQRRWSIVNAKVANENSVESEESVQEEDKEERLCTFLCPGTQRQYRYIKDKMERRQRGRKKQAYSAKLRRKLLRTILWGILKTTIFRILAPNNSPSSNLSSAPTSANSSARPPASQFSSKPLHLCSSNRQTNRQQTR